MISVKNLGKVYADGDTGIPALSDVSFEIKRGEFVSIMGPSGSGKSTLLHILSFLNRPTSGFYSFSGKSINELSDEDLAHIRNKEMGFVFQSFNLLSRSTVYDNVELPLLYARDIAISRRRQMVEEAVEEVGLEEKINTEAGRLSGGQKQRVAIARALVIGPNVIFADEPTGNLDSKSGGQVMEVFTRLHKDGRTIILVTHETYTAELAERLILLKDGMVESDRSVKKQNHAKEFFK